MEKTYNIFKDHNSDVAIEYRVRTQSEVRFSNEEFVGTIVSTSLWGAAVAMEELIDKALRG